MCHRRACRGRQSLGGRDLFRFHRSRPDKWVSLSDISIIRFHRSEALGAGALNIKSVDAENGRDLIFADNRFVLFG